ncbi:MAG: GerMN domain-containing protein [Acidobacteriota bacterium]
MKRVGWTVLAVAGCLALVVLVFELATPGGPPPAGPPPTAGRPAGAPPAPPPSQDGNAGSNPEGLRTLDVILYFLNPDGLSLAPEPRTIFDTAALLDRMKQTVVEVIRGPVADPRLFPALPPATSVRDLYLDASGTVYLDLDQELVRGLPPGATSEKLAVASLVNTLSENFPQVNRLRLLVGGEEVNTLGGHLDLTRSFKADDSLISPLPTVSEEDGLDGESPEREAPAQPPRSERE